MLCLYIGMSRVQRQWRRKPFVYTREQVCIGWHRTGACYTNKLTFSHGSFIDEWRRRLSACVDADGGHFEHYL